MADAVIKYMTERFLAWKLPDDFNPDAGISFTPTFNDHLPVPMRHEPFGTNLLNYAQAEAMVRHLIDGLAKLDQAEFVNALRDHAWGKDVTDTLSDWCRQREAAAETILLLLANTELWSDYATWQAGHIVRLRDALTRILDRGYISEQIDEERHDYLLACQALEETRR